MLADNSSRGTFSFPGGETPWARWDGSAWVAHSVGQVPAGIEEFVGFQGSLFGAGASGVWRYDGQTWLQLFAPWSSQLVSGGTHLYWTSPNSMQTGIFRWQPGMPNPALAFSGNCYYLGPSAMDAWGNTIYMYAAQDSGGGSGRWIRHMLATANSTWANELRRYEAGMQSLCPNLSFRGTTNGEQFVTDGVRWRGAIIGGFGTTTLSKHDGSAVTSLTGGIRFLSGGGSSLVTLFGEPDGAIVPFRGYFRTDTGRSAGVCTSNQVWFAPPTPQIAQVSPSWQVVRRGGYWLDTLVHGNTLYVVRWYYETFRHLNQTFCGHDQVDVLSIPIGSETSWVNLGVLRSGSPVNACYYSGAGDLHALSNDLVAIGAFYPPGESWLQSRARRRDPATDTWGALESAPELQLGGSACDSITWQGELYVMGPLNLPGVGTAQVARWDGTMWHALSTPANFVAPCPWFSDRMLWKTTTELVIQSSLFVQGSGFHVKFYRVTPTRVVLDREFVVPLEYQSYDTLQLEEYNGDLFALSGATTLVDGTPLPSGVVRSRNGVWQPFEAAGFFGAAAGKPTLTSMRRAGNELFFGGSFTHVNGQDSAAIVRWRDDVVCNDLDFNNDGMTQDPTDLEAFLSVYSGAACVPATSTCDSLDFNNDGIEQDPTDIEAFLSVYSGGPCV